MNAHLEFVLEASVHHRSDDSLTKQITGPRAGQRRAKYVSLQTVRTQV